MSLQEQTRASRGPSEATLAGFLAGGAVVSVLGVIMLAVWLQDTEPEPQGPSALGMALVLLGGGVIAMIVSGLALRHWHTRIVGMGRVVGITARGGSYYLQLEGETRGGNTVTQTRKVPESVYSSTTPGQSFDTGRR